MLHVVKGNYYAVASSVYGCVCVLVSVCVTNIYLYIFNVCGVRMSGSGNL